MRIGTMCWIKRQHVLLESKVFDLVMALVYCYMSIVCTEKSLSLITQRRQINKTYISFIDIPFKYKLFNYMYFLLSEELCCLHQTLICYVKWKSTLAVMFTNTCIYTFVLQDVLQVRSLFIASCSFLTGITNYQN